jgi:fructuronate reductase
VIGIVHLGLGAFHRAHQAVYTEDAVAAEPGPWGICGVAWRRRTVVDALRARGGRYTVLERGPDGDRARTVGIIREALVAAEDPDRVCARIADPATSVVTLTVTEGGYGPDPEGLLALLARGLRSRSLEDPLTVLSCDNLARNGEVARRAVHALCDPGPNVSFPSTVVDRIVPTPDDPAVVVAEPYADWVIEDRFAGPRPAWEHAGARLVADARPFEALKLRLVNGTHSALAHLGLRAGHATVAEAIADPELEAFVHRLLAEELVPTLPDVPGVDVGDFLERMLERFANPRIEHRLEQIATGYADKLPQRLVPPARELLAAGREPTAIAAVVTAAGLELDDLITPALRAPATATAPRP